MSRPLRTGYGLSADSLERDRQAQAEADWDNSTLAVRDAAETFRAVLGDRRKREAEEAEQRDESRFV
jgi:hypothetical protein